MKQAEPPSLSALIQALCCLPGIGKKSAQRISYHLLQRDRDGAKSLALALTDAMEKIGSCERCRNFSEAPICGLCLSDKRDGSLLCIVESPADVFAMEAAGYNGKYFVLMGHLSPLDGIGPQELGLDKLERVKVTGQSAELLLTLEIDDAVADDCALIHGGHAGSAGLGPLSGPVSLGSA